MDDLYRYLALFGVAVFVAILLRGIWRRTADDQKPDSGASPPDPSWMIGHRNPSATDDNLPAAGEGGGAD